MKFTKRELTRMVYAIGEANENCFLASRIYAEKYPDEKHPDERAFKKLKKRFENTGSVNYTVRKRRKVVSNEENSFKVIASAVENPHVSQRQAERQLGISKTSVHRILRIRK
jgi:Helix-turn-helix domain (DUF4817)